MKMLVYMIKQSENDEGVILSEKWLQWSEANEAIAKAEAYNGEYTIEDDGQPEPAPQPTDAERIAELEATLNVLLGVNE